jgi:hypothetical protein
MVLVDGAREEYQAGAQRTTQAVQVKRLCTSAKGHVHGASLTELLTTVERAWAAWPAGTIASSATTTAAT